MTTRHVVLVHGTWGRGTPTWWGSASQAFTDRGFTVHTPTLRHHELPREEGAPLIAGLSLLDYTDDLVRLCRSLDSPPLVVGLSMGGLLVQLVAARTPVAGVVAGAPAPAAGIFAVYPTMIRLFGTHFFRPGLPWRRPLMPTMTAFELIAQHQPREHVRELLDDAVAESGRAYSEMSFPYLDRRHAATVDFDAISAPVLVIGAEQDRAVNRRIPRTTARKYRDADHVEIPGADHALFHEPFLDLTMAAVDHWMLKRAVFTSTT
ncbi:MAG: alpha/beta hydrolase [Rhodococcus sp.]|nr:alpha/beta hydrolase [Rhodococcus sp. (in: high G+C Gram-positive bacteria)]MBJ7324855.1 alpha/beta hydrolase [Rhodococcus sp. (in: high G+C Gram-positive bacteria)]